MVDDMRRGKYPLGPQDRELGRRLRALREKLGFRRQMDLAMRMNKSEKTIAGYEQGRARPHLPELAAALGIGLPRLLKELGLMAEMNDLSLEEALNEFLARYPEARVYFAKLVEYDSDDAESFIDLLASFDRGIERKLERERQQRETE